MEALHVFEAQELLRLLTATSVQDQEQQQRQSPPSSQTPKFCPGVLEKYFNESQIPYLTELYRKADEYHNMGGNLLALQEFLDEAIDHTYEKLGINFVVDGDSKPNNDKSSGNKQKILDELKRRDVDNRGGYYQRALPGSFTGLRKGIEKFGDQRFVDVMEPKTHSRWDVAMGPRLEQDCCQGFATLPGPPRKRYEDKYICGWDKLAHSHHSENNNKNP